MENFAALEVRKASLLEKRAVAGGGLARLQLDCKVAKVLLFAQMLERVECSAHAIPR